MTDDQLDQILQNKFGFTSFRPGQKETLQALLANQATLAVLPTGSGKSLLFQLPAYLFKGLIVVISPLIALMQDQVDRLRAQGQFKVALINSALSFTERKQTLVQLDQYRFLFISPESLANAQVQQRLQRMSIGLFVIDEAHCISQWGPDFRPEYLLLKQIIHNLIPDHLLMLTATATPAVQNDIINKLGLKKNTVKVISRSVDRPNIFLAVKKVADEEEKRTQLLHLLQQLKTSGVVYLSSRKLASEMAAWVQEKSSLKVAAYHAGQNRRERFVIQQQFMQGKLDVIFATSAFGMGIDKGNIRFVIHYHLPGSLEAYWQEIGRAGRDGQAALAILLYAPGDESLPAMLMSHELPTDDQVQLWKKKPRQPQIMGPNGEVVAFYLEHGWSLKQVGQLFNQQYQQGLQCLYNMRGYVNTPTCRREYVLHYFAEEMRSKPENCCDIDQSHWSIDQLKLPQEKPAQAVMHDNWQQRLQRLLGSE